MDRTIEPRYDAIADWYSSWIETSWSHAVIANQLLPLCGDVSGQRVLDVACGEGVFGRLLAKQGAEIHGIDISEKLIASATLQAETSDLRLSYSIEDAQGMTGLEDEAFDGAICIMALMDIPDLPAVYAATRRVVHDGGWFTIAITHPCFDSPHAGWLNDDVSASRTLAHYLNEGEWHSTLPESIRARVGAHHRTLSTYFNEANRAGWTLEHLIEPPGGPDGQNPLIARLLLARFHAT